MRTDDEIKARMQSLEKEDWMGIERNDLFVALSYEAAKPDLKEGTTAEQYADAGGGKNTAEHWRQTILDYMPFAWDKANHCRGISASRSISHMSAWLWLLGDEVPEPLMERVSQQKYQFYGKELLASICELFQWDWTQWDDGQWRRREDGPALTAAVARLML